MEPTITPITQRTTPPRPTITSPMIRLARPTTTIPVPSVMSLNFWCWASRPPLSATSALAMHRPTVVVKAGLMEDAATMSRLSPVARMDRPSWVPRKATIAAPAASATRAASTSAPSCSPKMPSAQLNTVSTFKRGRVALPPITIRLME